MKKFATLLTTLAVMTAGVQTACAGDKEWATAGKILTGVFAGSVLTRALEPAPVYTYQTTAYYSPPVCVQPATVVVQPAPVIVHPAPTVVYAQPVYVSPAPVVTYHFSYRRGYFCHPRPTFCW